MGRVAFMIGVLAVLTTMACVPPDSSATSPGWTARTDEDVFRDKIAAGCATLQDCNALLVESRERFDRCANAPQTDAIERACKQQIEDRVAAERAASSMGTAKTVATQGEIRPVPTGIAAGQVYEDNENVYRENMKRLKGSCEDIKTLADMAVAAPTPEIRDRYQRRAITARNSRMEDIPREIQSLISRHGWGATDLPNFADPTEARKEIEYARSLVTELRCYDAAATEIPTESESADAYRIRNAQPVGLPVDAGVTAQGDAELVERWAADREAAIQTEINCRATPDCMGARAAVPICKLIAERADAVRSMARERQNPSGYVDKAVLHDLGSDIQRDDEELRKLKGDFVATAHHPFTEKLCARPRAAP